MVSPSFISFVMHLVLRCGSPEKCARANRLQKQEPHTWDVHINRIDNKHVMCIFILCCRQVFVFCRSRCLLDSSRVVYSRSMRVLFTRVLRVCLLKLTARACCCVVSLFCVFCTRCIRVHLLTGRLFKRTAAKQMQVEPTTHGDMSDSRPLHSMAE